MVDIVYPPRCAGCGRRGVWVCRDCMAALPRFAPPWCARCGAPLGYAECRCPQLPPSLQSVRSAARYDGWLRAAIIAFKYGDEPARAPHLGDLAASAAADLMPVDLLVPVPLHPRRLKSRGYNQAALLARRLSERLDIPHAGALVRLRATPQQVGLGASERCANVAGAFAVRDGTHPSGLRIVLVDDVLTTGSTLGACAEALLTAGAASVVAVTVAREG